MKQIFQNLKTGHIDVLEVPCPKVKQGNLLIRTSKTLISSGTERMLVEFGRANLLAKAQQQPEKVKQLIEKIKTDGFVNAAEAVFAKLDQNIPLGYCNVGRVLEVGGGVIGFKPGDRVVSNGRHSEVVCVPKNLCVKIPDEVDDDTATFVVISSIALQGIRLLNPSIGESICVFGLGLIGLIACQILEANGINVLGFDYDDFKVGLAQEFGAKAINLSSNVDPIESALNISNGYGVDGVLVAAYTKSHELMHQAAQMTRQRGKIVLTGVAGLHLDRSDFYEKELSFQVSCSYGPGRYDPLYETEGIDYPQGFVRWTEHRNFEAILGLMRTGKLHMEKLISERFPVEKAKDAYELLFRGKAIGIIFEYSNPKSAEVSDEVLIRREVINLPECTSQKKVVAAVIGAGNFAVRQMIPALKKTDARLKYVASSSGVSSTHAARKFFFERNTTDYKRILDDPEVNAVFIATRHSSHARIVIESLQSGKNVFVEKPMCILPEELDQVVSAYLAACQNYKRKLLLMVGFNRRFSILTSEIKKLIDQHQKPISISFTCNAGRIHADHWTQKKNEGGGRIIGEAVHFIDYLHYLVNSPIVRVSASKLGVSTEHDLEDNASITLVFFDGSIGQINYFSEGSKSYPKEHMEIFFDGKVLQLENFKRLRGYGTTAIRSKRLLRQDKGHAMGFSAFVQAIKNGRDSPIVWNSILNVHKATFAAIEAMRNGIQVSL